jgi:5'-nucleotidase
MRILVTNDDGIYSPGLLALAKAAAQFGDVRVVAPDVEQSSMGHAITASRPLSFKKTTLGDFQAHRVNGTPADCVALGAYNWEKVDVVLSGFNLCPTLGNSVWHTGTLAAAKQAALLGLRGVALSTPAGRTEPAFEVLAPYVHRVLECLLLQAPWLKLVNVNFPRQPKGLMWTRQSVRQYDGDVVPGEDPMGRKHFWLTVRPIEESDQGTDRWAVKEGWVSLTPLELDLTDHAALERVKSERPLE